MIGLPVSEAVWNSAAFCPEDYNFGDLKFSLGAIIGRCFSTMWRWSRAGMHILWPAGQIRPPNMLYPTLEAGE